MKILLITADAEPLFPVAVATAPAAAPPAPRLSGLGMELHRAGHEVSVVAPLGAGLADRRTALRAKATGVRLATTLGGTSVQADVLAARSPAGLQTFLIRQEESPENAGPAPAPQPVIA